MPFFLFRAEKYAVKINYRDSTISGLLVRAHVDTAVALDIAFPRINRKILSICPFLTLLRGRSILYLLYKDELLCFDI